jgi:hypothetical protein
LGQWIELAASDVGTADYLGNVRYIRVTTTSSPSWVGWQKIEVYQGTEYFGYFMDSTDNLGIGCKPHCDFSSETTANGANVNITDSYLENLPGHLSKSQRLGNKLIILPASYLFDASGLRSDWLTQWGGFSKAIKDGHFENTVAAFMFDEPYINRPQNSMKQWLTTITNQMKADFPSIPTAINLDAASVVTFAAMPHGESYVAMADWVGFDAYDTWSDGYGYAPSGCASTGAVGGMCTLINNLRSLLRPEQRMMALPSAALPLGPSFGDTSASTQYWAIDTNINMWQQEVLSDSRYVLVMPFLWQSYSEESRTGARDLPHIKDRLYEMAYATIPRTTNRIFPVSFDASSSYPDFATSPPYADNPPWLAFDLNPNTMWNSGCYGNNYCPYSNPPQKSGIPWVGATFAGLTHITRIELTVVQDPAGTTEHVLSAHTANGWQQLARFNGYTTTNQKLVWTGSVDMDKFHVETDVDASWVAWTDIQFCAPADPTTPCS